VTEAMTITLLLISLGLAWLAIGQIVASSMAKRGYDRTAWVIVGALFGPVVLVFAVIELLTALPRRPEVVDRGSPGQGTVDVLIVVDLSQQVGRTRLSELDVTRHVRHSTVAAVLPRDGARLVEVAAVDRLRAVASELRPAGDVALLFGLAREVVVDFATSNGVEVVVLDASDTWLAARLRSVGITVLSTAGAIARFGSRSRGRRDLEGAPLPLRATG
jgi:hypothetical protein